VLTTYIFKLTNWSPPLYSTAASVAIILMVVTGFWCGCSTGASRRSYTTVAGKAFRPRCSISGAGATSRWACDHLPVRRGGAADAGADHRAFRKFLFDPRPRQPVRRAQYSLDPFRTAVRQSAGLRSIVNTMEVGLITALVGGVLAFAIGYTINRTSAPAPEHRLSLDAAGRHPGLVVGVAYLWAWIGLPAGSTARSGSWRWPSSPASCPTP
jgi:iron(III) transport system permease protein